MSFRIRCAVVAVGLILIAGCSSDTTSNAGATTTLPVATTTSTVDSTPDTVAETTSPATTVPAPIVFTLRGDGIGPFDFGHEANEVIDAMTTQFGPATSDESREYLVNDGFGGYQTADGEYGFAYLYGRTLCWSFAFCAEFGDLDAQPDSFVGWTYNEPSGLTLASTSGVTIGSRWSDFPAMNVNPGGCYTIGYGDIDGIALTLQSDGVEFGTFDDGGNYIEAIPPPEQVTVVFMEAGEIPIGLFGDC